MPYCFPHFDSPFLFKNVKGVVYNHLVYNILVVIRPIFHCYLNYLALDQWQCQRSIAHAPFSAALSFSVPWRFFRRGHCRQMPRDNLQILQSLCRCASIQCKSKSWQISGKLQLKNPRSWKRELVHY